MMTTGVISLVRQWNQELSAEESIVADASNELFRSRDVLDMLSDHSMPQVAEASAGRIIGFPLRIAGLELVDSKARLGVKLDDVVAGNGHSGPLRYWPIVTTPDDPHRVIVIGRRIVIA